MKKSNENTSLLIPQAEVPSAEAQRRRKRGETLRLWAGFAVAPALVAVAVGCGSSGHVSNTRSAELSDDILSITQPGDPTKVQDMETMPREQFARGTTAEALIYPSADGAARDSVQKGLNIFLADRHGLDDGQGPYFNQVNCVGCHQATGTSGLTPSPVTRSKAVDAFLVFGNYNPTDGAFESPASLGGPVLHKRNLPGFPNQAIPPLPGAPYERTIGLRAAPGYIGRGLMEAVYDGDIIASKDPNLNGLIDANGNQIAGFENRNTTTGLIVGGDNVTRLSRFGLRAGGPTLLQFALGQSPDGLSSPFSPGQNVPSNKPDVHPSYDLTADDLRNVLSVIRLMAPPARIPIAPGSVEDQGRVLFGADFSHVADANPTPAQKRGMLPVAERDMKLGALNCVGCHMPVQVTGISPSKFGNALLSNRRAYIFSDLMIHNMGKGLATASLNVQSYVDDANIPKPSQDTTIRTAADFGLAEFGKTPRFPIDDNALPSQGRATPFHFRTATLMGVALIGPPYFHDSRISENQSVESALDQAIRMHAASSLTIPSSQAELDQQSEAYVTVSNYLKLSQSQKDALIAYLKTL